ncbi:MAG: hypothetical protein ACYSUK_08575 [Planctomycetota bacterium]|jgi:hypothetical protein
MPIDIKGLNKPSRFYWPGSDDEWVELRHINLSEIKKIRRTTVTRRAEYHQTDKDSKPFRYEVEDTDEDRADELLWDYQIVDWNLVDPDGKKIKCDKKNKLLLMGNSAEFVSFVVDNLNRLASDEKERQEKSEKN